MRLALPSSLHLINQLSIITNHVLLCALDTSLQLEMPSFNSKNSQINTTEGSVWGCGYLRPASWELAQRRRARSEKYDTATRAAPAIFFKKNSVKLTCIEGLSLSLTRSRTPKIPKRKGTLTIKPAKRVGSFAFIVVGVFVVAMGHFACYLLSIPARQVSA